VKEYEGTKDEICHLKKKKKRKKKISNKVTNVDLGGGRGRGKKSRKWRLVQTDLKVCRVIGKQKNPNAGIQGAKMTTNSAARWGTGPKEGGAWNGGRPHPETTCSTWF